MWHKKKLFFIFFVILDQAVCLAAQCQNQFFGENNFGGASNVDSNTNYGYLMSHDDYVVDCCGVVDEWKVKYAGVSGTRTIYFQLWRQTTADVYELVGQNSESVNADGEKTTPVSQSDRITIKPGDKFGWWSSGTDIVAYQSTAIFNNDMMTLTSKTVGETQDWTSATVENGRGYAVRMGVTDNSDPDFTNLPDTITIQAAAAIGTSIFDVSVDDIDTYDVSSLTVSKTTNTDFSFNASINVLSTATSFSASSIETIEFKVVDQCDNTATATLTVSIVNEPPQIISLPASGTVSEDETLETLLHTLNVSDPESGTITCSLAASVPASYPFMVRLIPSTTDYGLYSESSPGFDYSTQTSYTLTVECSDGEFTDSNTFTVILVQNVPPVILNLQNSTSISTTVPIGFSVFTVLVDDTDDVTFTMTCSSASCPFQIYNSGDILVTEDVSGLTTVGYDLFISVSDGRNTAGLRSLTVTVADINDPVTLSNLPISLAVAENTAVGTSLFTVSFNDVDTSQAHTISMTSTPTSGLNYFTINTTTGEVKSVGELNYETMASHTFVFDVTVSDPVTSDTGSLTIEITNENEAPSFSQAGYSISATEGTTGAVLGTPDFGVTDPDNGDAATLTIDCGEQTGYFLMDSTSGQVSYQSNYDLDTGLLPTEVNCNVTATDIVGLSDTARLLITIADYNDNAPVFSPTNYVFYVSYYANAGTSIGTITATDADVGSYGVLTYSIDQSHLGAEYFAISSSGEISVKTTPQGSALSYASSATVVATASDVGALTDTAEITIIISDTTTTSTTTTTDRYRHFIEDVRNIAWLSVCLVVLLISICILVYVIYTCKGGKGCSKCRRALFSRSRKDANLSKYRRRSFESNRRKDSSDHYRPAAIRMAPPPIEFQAWRKNVV